MMKIAVFDFDGTLVYSPSSLVWTRDVSIFKRVLFPFTYLFEKITKKSSYQKKAFEWLVGLNLSKTVKVLNDLPEVPNVVKKFQEYHDQCLIEGIDIVYPDLRLAIIMLYILTHCWSGNITRQGCGNPNTKVFRT